MSQMLRYNLLQSQNKYTPSTHLKWIYLALDLLDAVFWGHQLSLLSGHNLSNLLSLLFVLLQIAQLHLTFFNCLTFFEAQLTHCLQRFDISNKKKHKVTITVYCDQNCIECCYFSFWFILGYLMLWHDYLNITIKLTNTSDLLGCSKDGVKFFFEGFAFTEWPVRLFLVAKNNMIQHRLGYS